MKAKLWVSSSLLIALFGFSAYNLRSWEDKDELIIKLMMQNLKSQHYENIEVNDKFSESIFKLYLSRVDYAKRFLTKGDIAQLEAFKDDIDDEINNLNYGYFNATEEILSRRTQQAQTYYREILAQPFDFTVAEQVEVDPDKIEFVKDAEELKARWYKVLKYQTMLKLADLLEEQNEAMVKKDTSVHEKNFSEMEAEARKRVLKNNDDYFQRLNKLKASDRRAIYLNTIVGVYDPHTNYYPPEDKENFDISMSGKLEGIGATLQEKDGYIKVANIFPGSPSFRQGELKEGDLITKVAQGIGEPVDVVEMPLDEAVRLIRGKKGTEVRLTVKKPDGAIKVISIIRDVVIIEETFAKSLVIQDKNSSQKYGYIYLPRFYADFQDPRGRRCAQDIKAEIEKLQTEGISGIILDLRNNGGGSLTDVVDMTGLFIDKGPVVQVKARSTDPQVMSDNNRLYSGTLYDGKLVVMVNSNSASASEILAAAIQDYKRGVIIGSPMTFGKGTVQRFYNLDEYLPGESDVKPLGSVKMTTQKFYRINGGATQLKGVASDVVLPDNFSYIENGEREQDYYLPWDEIKPVQYTLWKNPVNVEALKRSSKKRVDANPVFQLINERAKKLKEQSDEVNYTLNLTEHQSIQKRLKEQSEKLEKELEKEIPEIVPITIASEEKYIQGDTTRVRLHNDWKKNIKKDIYLYEAMQVLNDMR
ncbi:MAG: carboxy terminal-processing peptidase [Bacteroidia bacterium]|nr:carboxy terminal-processing peptidase [Bacteroidia bacterium]